MKKLFFLLSIAFSLLTFAGAIYVLKNHGTANAGYAMVPMVLSLSCLGAYRSYKDKEAK